MKKTVFLFIIFASLFSAKAQLSVASDASVIGQFGGIKTYWGLAQDVKVSYPIGPKTSAYLSVGYAIPNKLKEAFSTQAYSPLTTPQVIRYQANTNRQLRQAQIGIMQYLAGSHKAESGTNVYLLAGVGIMSVKASTSYSVDVDTAEYPQIRPYAGEGSAESFSVNAGLGIEQPLGGNFFWYAEAKGWLPTKSLSSPFLKEAEKTPAVLVGVGIRVLFGYY